MKAMILAAGFGTRLQPLTDNTPKALVNAGGMSLLERLIHKMKVQGVTDIVINLHHHADQVIHFLEEKDNFGISISISHEKDKLLETGGGILHAKDLLDGDEAFIVHNVDVLSDLDLRKIYADHTDSSALATLAVRSRETSRYLLFDDSLRMHGWENRSSGERITPAGESSKMLALAFSGIHVISPQIFSLFTETGAFSIIKTYLRLCSKYSIMGFRHDKGLWIDAGKPDGLKMANFLMGGGEI
jgi:NDP-sugar pyrophosphorylase family protein